MRSETILGDEIGRRPMPTEKVRGTDLAANYQYQPETSVSKGCSFTTRTALLEEHEPHVRNPVLMPLLFDSEK